MCHCWSVSMEIVCLWARGERERVSDETNLEKKETRKRKNKHIVSLLSSDILDITVMLVVFIQSRPRTIRVRYHISRICISPLSVVMVESKLLSYARLCNP